MKSKWTVTALLVGAILLGGTVCALTQDKTKNKAEETPAVSETAVDGGAKMVNPMKEADNDKAFQDIGVTMHAPIGASDIKYYIIGGTLSQINFTYNGVEYIYRGSQQDGDIAGVYEEFEEPVTHAIADYAWGSVDAAIKTTKSGGHLAQWRLDPVQYALYARTGGDTEAMQKLILSELVLGSAENPDAVSQFAGKYACVDYSPAPILLLQRNGAFSLTVEDDKTLFGNYRVLNGLVCLEADKGGTATLSPQLDDLKLETAFADDVLPGLSTGLVFQRAQT